jgi:hypothetical protein
MADDSGWPGQNTLMSGLFGVLQTAAQSRLPTADVWSTLRQAAGAWQFQAAGREILSQAGVGIQQVNTYRGLAGQWLAAKQRLQAADGDSQIVANQIFKPPWATTIDGAVPDRFRLRVAWQITPTAGDVFTKWSTYELTTPLTTINDALAAAGDKAAGDKYLALLSGDSLPTVSDYEIEQV